MGDSIFREGDSPEALGEEVLEDYGADIVSVVDEDGNEHVFEELARVELDEGAFVALAPLVGEEEEEAEGDDELILLRVEEENGEVYLSPIEEEELFNKVGHVFSEKLGIPFMEE
ncbi:MAG: DUF1292 domain-containing protein [Oscillospiraceae bacterium]|jgi:uncharacterized protein YrzB (UPF0473 family)|nr:DUF1292 domain-containing protein [Oscillospiraceae bacterium]